MTQNSPTPADEAFAAESEAYNEEGIDLTLIRWMLSLSLEERLQVLQNNLNAMQMMRREITIR